MSYIQSLTRLSDQAPTHDLVPFWADRSLAYMMCTPYISCCRERAGYYLNYLAQVLVMDLGTTQITQNISKDQMFYLDRDLSVVWICTSPQGVSQEADIFNWFLLIRDIHCFPSSEQTIRSSRKRLFAREQSGPILRQYDSG